MKLSQQMRSLRTATEIIREVLESFRHDVPVGSGRAIFAPNGAVEMALMKALADEGFTVARLEVEGFVNDELDFYPEAPSPPDRDLDDGEMCYPVYRKVEAGQ